MKAYQMKITIKGSRPPIWRRFIVPEGLTFTQLSDVLNKVVGWCGYHLFSFDFNSLGIRIEKEDDEFMDDIDDFECLDSDDTLIDSFLDREHKFNYIYDFGDDWQHSVVVEKKISDYDKRYPTVQKYQGQTPYEDCGGIWDYYDLLEILKNPEDPQYEELKEWTDHHFTKKYDMKRVNRELKEIVPSDAKSRHVKVPEIFDDTDDFFSYAENDLNDIEAQLEELEKMLEELERQQGQIHSNLYQFITDNGEITLENLLGEHKKENLVFLAKLHQIKKYSHLKKKELARYIGDKMLDKDVMCRYFTFLSDEELNIIEKYSGETPDDGSIPEEDIKAAEALAEGGYCVGVDWGNIIVPAEVAEAYRKNCDDEWKKVREKALTLSYYMNTCAGLYGICPVEKVLELYEKYTGNKVEVETMDAFCRMVPMNRKNYYYADGILTYKIIQDSNTVEEIKKQQKGKSFYIPTREEIEYFGKYRHLPFDKYLKSLSVYFRQMYPAMGEDAEELCEFVQSMFRMGQEVSDVMEIILASDFSGKPAQDTEMRKLLNAVYKHTRTIPDRGNYPGKGITAVRSSGEQRNRSNIIPFPSKK